MIPTLLQILFEAISHCFIKCFNHSCSRDFPALSRFIHVLFMFYSVVLAFQFCHVLFHVVYPIQESKVENPRSRRWLPWRVAFL